MDLYKGILLSILQNKDIQVTFPNMEIEVQTMIELECYKALNKIKSILEDDRLNDEECFMKIDEIIYVFENLNSFNGSRHDF